jgi:uncharacterized protein (DUF302 family)
MPLNSLVSALFQLRLAQWVNLTIPTCDRSLATAGLTTVSSAFGQSETMQRLNAAIEAAGMTVFARIDHAAAAADVHLALRPTELVIFGNAKGGTPLMQACQAIGIDLPLKVLVYQEVSGQVQVAYNDPKWLAERHGLGEALAPAVAGITAALKMIVARSTGSHTPA